MSAAYAAILPMVVHLVVVLLIVPRNAGATVAFRVPVQKRVGDVARHRSSTVNVTFVTLTLPLCVVDDSSRSRSCGFTGRKVPKGPVARLQLRAVRFSVRTVELANSRGERSRAHPITNYGFCAWI